ncbi:GNAT family N-acetyltransferase [Dactylosporangium matsuzakiense]|uniref:GNAT family N-acetyltransferase n=1 Tax=Dactylosporangium matsuzakiense TaxID=53360 RepID=UPI0021C2B3E4|nr:GNAT family N-acetyltransferase [Dactylosporangium matsuzakiense]UWZ40934.1 GNAT family N-acetyltransferase [Dactylosporangium matsuzakiense]
MSDKPQVAATLRPLREDDLPTMFDIQFDAEAQRQAAFVDGSGRDREAYYAKFRKILADDAIVKRAVEVGGEVVGSAAAYPSRGAMEVTYWIRRDWWGRGVATAALAALVAEVPGRPIYGGAVADNVGSLRVLERNGFVPVGREEGFAEARQATVTELVYRLD